MAIADTYVVTVLLDVNETQDVDDRAESRSHIVADRSSGQAVIIDAVIENVERDIRITKKLGLTIRFVIETHIHVDHLTGASLIKKRTGAQNDTIVYPEHDYQGRASSTIGEEKQFNERLNLSINKETFVEMMDRRKTPRPAKMDIAIPANMRAGRMIGP